MSIDAALTRIAELSLAPTAAAPPAAVASLATSPLTTPSLGVTTQPASFAAILAAAGGTAAPGATPPVVTIAAGEVGQAEQPPGSNDSPRIAEYRSAVAGAGVGPWCAYFASWAAAQAGTPIGPDGAGLGSCAGIWQWAQQTGRALPAGPGTAPQPGDLILWGDAHVGIVESVAPDGSMQTIEGNSGNGVTRHSYGPGGDGATGYVRLG